MLSLLIITSFLQFTFWIDFLPWRTLAGPRQGLAAFNLLLGLGVCIYTGILLGSMRPRGFWNTPALPVLFLVSGLSTGVALQSLLKGFWPYAGGEDAAVAVHGSLASADLILIVLELIVLLVYVLMMRTTAGLAAAQTAARWLTGTDALAFWGGVIGLGLLLPFVLYLLRVQVIPSLCVLTGGLILRLLVVYSDDRTFLPGEVKYLSRLPRGDEAFLKALK
jgi:formate-dependent nitrite reductase membrane component NrfD